MYFLIIFILGLCVGSFLNVLIYREAQDELALLKKGKKKTGRLPDWIAGRSYCDHCRKKLAWFDNIPLLSFILLKGRCRYCRKKISPQYPLLELLVGLEFIWVYFLIQGQVNFFSRFEGFYSFLSLLVWLGLGACLAAILIADWRWRIIPDSAVFGAIFLALLKIGIDYRYTGMIDFSFFTAALLAGLFFSALVWLTKGKGMGIGDIKLAFLIGLLLGFPRTIIAISLAFLTGAVSGVILILLGKKGLKSQIAFGPFLIIGLLGALVWGEKTASLLLNFWW